MKRSTAVRHLVELADAANERLRFRATDIGWPLEELWATGVLNRSTSSSTVRSC